MDTPPNNVKRCSKCDEDRPIDEFPRVRRVCKGCRHKYDSEKHQNLKAKCEEELKTLKQKQCTICEKTQPITSFIKCKTFCKDCNNDMRRKKYSDDPEHRAKKAQAGSKYKKKKTDERRNKKIAEIGIGNKKCSVCSTIKPSERFRHNRLKCKDCERDDPKDKFNRVIRSRIYNSLKNKTSHTIEYLGCSYVEYHAWIFDHNYNLDNRSDWHIDHVIPLSTFNLDDPAQQLLAFNWRNTTPLSCKENLTKNKKVIQTQVEQHWNKLAEYHTKKNMIIPQPFVELFQQRNQIAGTPLEPLLPLTLGNVCEELG